MVRATRLRYKATGIATAPPGHHKTRDDRQREAKERKFSRDLRSNHDQLIMIASRRGESRREKNRLTA